MSITLNIVQLAILSLVLQALTNAVGAQQSLSSGSLQSSPNVTSPLEDYIMQNQRQYAAIVTGYEFQIAAFRESYTAQVQVLSGMSPLIEAKFQEFDQWVNPLEVLSDWTKHCVQIYRSKVLAISSVRSSISSCSLVANNNLDSVILNTVNVKNSLVNYYSGVMARDLTSCEKTYAGSYVNHTLCVERVISAANVYTSSNQKSFATALDQSQCSSGSRVSTATDCNFSALFKATESVTEAKTLISQCIEGPQEQCKPCDSCPNNLYLQVDNSVLTNSTLPNPLYGQKFDKPCLQVNFVATKS